MIEYVNGIKVIVSRAGIPIAASRQSMSPTLFIMRYATMISAGAVASGGTTPAIGEKNIASRNSTPTTTDVRPVRPPSPIPAPDSI